MYIDIDMDIEIREEKKHAHHLSITRYQILVFHPYILKQSQVLLILQSDVYDAYTMDDEQ